ncbi:MAG: hypothetical protein SVY10_10350 [Thermodesulfobacteriota bacterium]|nr:hypothetical protein [Thermodesulfobacteriota bacterium]
MGTSIPSTNHLQRKRGAPRPVEGDMEITSINEARKKIGLPELLCKNRICIACGKEFKSIDASHRVCDKCRPKWERKRNQLEKAFVNIEDTDTFELQDLEELSIFENID